MIFFDANIKLSLILIRATFAVQGLDPILELVYQAI